MKCMCVIACKTKDESNEIFDDAKKKSWIKKRVYVRAHKTKTMHIQIKMASKIHKCDKKVVCFIQSVI